MISAKDSRVAAFALASLLSGSPTCHSAVRAEPHGPERIVEASRGTSKLRGDITGQWTASIKKGTADQVEVMFLHRSPRYGLRMEFESVALSEVRGPGAGVVDLTITREAGTFRLKGNFADRRGSGDWELTPALDFISGMRARGYGGLSPEDLYSAAIADLRLKLVDDLKSEGYTGLTFHELFEAAAFGITPEFIRNVKAAGDAQPSFEKLVAIKIKSKSK